MNYNEIGKKADDVEQKASDIGQKAEKLAKDIVSDIRELPLNSLFLAGLAGIGILSVLGCVGKLFTSRS